MTVMTTGALSKKIGNGFENLFEAESIRSGIKTVRVPDGCRRIPHPGGVRLIPVKSPFDFILSYNGRAAFVDTKSIGAKYFSHNKITEHQMQALLCLERDGHVAGYVVNFDHWKQVVFFPASRLNLTDPNNSMRVEDGVPLGSVFQLRLRNLFALPPSPVATPPRKE